MTHSANFAFIFFIIMILVTFFFELFYVIELIQKWNKSEACCKYVHYVLALFILHNVLGNLHQLISIDSSTRGVLLNQSIGKSVGYCSVCESVRPPRAFHCIECDICVLKRTHHCMFARCCVGYKNFRFFFMLLLWLCVGTFYASFLNMRVVWRLLGGFTYGNILSHTFPFLFWLYGTLHWSLAITCIISVVNICGCVFSASLFLLHGLMLVRNQTVFERSRKITCFDLGNSWINIQESLGERWYFIWLSPFIQSKLPRNGIDFPTLADYRPNSSKNK